MAEQFTYFLSYAHQDFDPYLDQFQADLHHELKRLSAGEVSGFMDRQVINAGDDWSAAARNALAHSKVLVALLSPAYLTSTSVARELQRYRDQAQGEEMPPVLPVLWSPRDAVLHAISPEMAEMQLDPPRMPEVYREEGLRFVMKLRKYKDAYQRCIRVLAEELLQMAEGGGRRHRHRGMTRGEEYEVSFHPAWSSTAVVRGGAREPDGWFQRMAPPATGPRHVRCAFLVPGREQAAAFRTHPSGYGHSPAEWRPFYPAETEPAGELVQQVCTDGKFLFHPVPDGRPVMPELEDAVAKGNLACLVVDPWAVRVPALARMLGDVGARHPANTAVVVLWNENDLETVHARAQLEPELETLLRDRMGDECGVVSVSSGRQLRAELAAALEALRMQTIEQSEHAPAAEPPVPAPLEAIDLGL